MFKNNSCIIQYLDNTQTKHGVFSKLNNVEYPYKHYHQFYEIVVVFSGKLNHYYNLMNPIPKSFSKKVIDKNGYITVQDPGLEFTTETLQAGDIQIVPPNLCHYYSFLSPSTAYINITVTTEIYNTIATLLNQKNILSFSTAKISMEDILTIKEEFLKIKSNESSFNIDSDPLETILLMNILKYFVRKDCQSKTEQLPSWIKEIISLSQNPQYYSLSIDEIINNIPYSHSYICKHFKKHVGVSLKNYIVSRKLNHACYLLINTDLKIVTIANMLGYSNQSFFAKTFYDAYHLTPYDYRKANKSATT